MSSLIVMLHLPVNNSLNLSRTIVGKFDIFFKIKLNPPNIAFKKRPGLNITSMLDKGLNSFSFSFSNSLSKQF